MNEQLIGVSKLDQWSVVNEDLIKDLKSQFPKIEFAEYDGIEQVFGIIPSPQSEMNRFTTVSVDKENRYGATYNLVVQCIKYPAVAQVTAILSENAGLIFPMFADIAEMSKLTSEGRRKKF